MAARGSNLASAGQKRQSRKQRGKNWTDQEIDLLTAKYSELQDHARPGQKPSTATVTAFLK